MLSRSELFFRMSSNLWIIETTRPRKSESKMSCRSKQRPLTWLLFAVGLLGWMVGREPDLVKQNLPARLRAADEPLSS